MCLCLHRDPAWKSELINVVLVFFLSRWISTSDFIPSPTCIDLNCHLKVMSFKIVQQQEKRHPKLSWGWHLQVRFNVELRRHSSPSFHTHVGQDCHLPGSPACYGDPAGVMLIWLHPPGRATHLQIAIETETTASKGRYLLDTCWFLPVLSSTYLFLQASCCYGWLKPGRNVWKNKSKSSK